MGRITQSKRRDEDDDDEDRDEDEREDEDEEDDEHEDKSNADSDDDDDEEEGDDLDSALNDRGSRASIYLDRWRQKGSTTVWIHPRSKFARVGRHRWFEIVSFTKRNGEEVSFIRFVNFNCHETPDYVRISKDRGDDLRRDHKACRCPFCKMLEWVEDQVISGKLSPAAEIFRFDDGDPEHLKVLHAAGISGLIQLKEAPGKWKKECKAAKVLQKDPWSENCSLKLSHVFQVVDDGDPSEVKWAVEPPDLFFALKDAIKKEKKRNGDDDGDPQKNPYALLWEFDEQEAKNNYGKGSTVIPQPKRKLTSKIRRLLNGPKRTDQMDVIGPGNCLELRAAMENAAVIDMPFDEFFSVVAKEGLMDGKVSESNKKDSKRADDDEDEPESDRKPKASSKHIATQAKGKASKDEEDDDSDVSTCDICDKEIGEDDDVCKACGTEFDPDESYEISGIKCTECKKLVPLDNPSEAGDDTLHICESCATIHRLSPSVRKYYDDHAMARKNGHRCDLRFSWKAEPKAETKSDKPKREGRSGRGRSSTKTNGNDEPFPF